MGDIKIWNTIMLLRKAMCTLNRAVTGIGQPRLYAVALFHAGKPNVMVEWLTPLIRIRRGGGVPSTNLGPGYRYPDWDFPWFSSDPPD
jgi:hypothetical protein